MVAYILKKVAYGFTVLFGVISVIFFLFSIVPGDPALIILGQRASKEAIENVHHELGTDRSLGVQYLNYLNDLSPVSIHNFRQKESIRFLNPEKYDWVSLTKFGSNVVVLKKPYLRRSYVSKRPVSDILAETLPETAVLAFSAMLLATLIGIGLGVTTAVKKDSLYDRSVFVLATVFGMSAPSFFTGLLLAWLFGYVWSDFTGLSPSGSLREFDVWKGETIQIKNLILPAITLGIRPLSVIIQLTRASMLDVMAQDYIRTARAKGLSRYRIITRHALRNALNPVVTTISGWLAGLLAGAVFVEKIFSWKGIGFEVVEGLANNDLPVVMGATIIFALIFAVINVLVDILYAYLDPRIRI